MIRPEVVSSVNPEFIAHLEEHVAAQKAFEESLIAKPSENVLPDTAIHKSEHRMSPRDRLRAGLFAAAAIIAGYQQYSHAAQPIIPESAYAPVSAEASAGRDGELPMDPHAPIESSDNGKDRGYHPIGAPQEDPGDIVRGIELKPAQARPKHGKRMWPTEKRTRRESRGQTRHISRMIREAREEQAS